MVTSSANRRSLPNRSPVIGASSLGQALSRYCRFFQLFEFDVNPVLENEGELAVIRLQETGSDRYTGECRHDRGLERIGEYDRTLILVLGKAATQGHSVPESQFAVASVQQYTA